MRAAALFLLGALLPLGLMPPLPDTSGTPLLVVSPAWRTRSFPWEANDQPVTTRAWRFTVQLPAGDPARRLVLVIAPEARAFPAPAALNERLRVVDAERALVTTAAAPATHNVPVPPRHSLDDPDWSEPDGAAA
jgi:hypothetical protein